jgi:hypothetical protein
MNLFGARKSLPQKEILRRDSAPSRLTETRDRRTRRKAILNWRSGLERSGSRCQGTQPFSRCSSCAGSGKRVGSDDRRLIERMTLPYRSRFARAAAFCARPAPSCRRLAERAQLRATRGRLRLCDGRIMTAKTLFAQALARPLLRSLLVQ